MADIHSIWMDLGKLVLAVLLSGAIGFEREAHGQAAGLRTYIIVGVGSCLMMLLSIRMEELYRTFSSGISVIRVDPGRIASYAIAGMGFLGAGAIIKGKGSVRGLTTAAGLWVVTGIGLAIGAGLIISSFLTTAIILGVLYIGHHARVFTRRRIYTMLSVKARVGETSLNQITDVILSYPTYALHFINYHHDISSQSKTYRIRLYSGDEGEKYWTEIAERISQLKGIEDIRWEESDVP